jgi:hypothetical protein
LRDLELGGKQSRREAAPTLSHMPFRFPIEFTFLTLGPCELLGKLQKLTRVLSRTSQPFPSSSPIFASVVLTQVVSLGEETRSGNGIGEVKETWTIAKTD